MLGDLAERLDATIPRRDGPRLEERLVDLLEPGLAVGAGSASQASRCPTARDSAPCMASITASASARLSSRSAPAQARRSVVVVSGVAEDPGLDDLEHASRVG